MAMMRLAGIAVALVPFAFAGLRFATTGTDLRYLWMAVTSTLCALLSLYPRRAAITTRRMVVAAAGSAGCAALAGVAQGATAVSGIAIMAAAFGACGGLGAGLALRAPARAA
jgi:hypothetical protein